MGFLFRSQSIATSEVALGGLRIQNAGYGVAIPLNYGKNRVPPTPIWYGNFKAIPHTTTQSSGGKGGGGVESSNTTFTYSAGIIFSLGEGPVADIGKMWVGKQSYAAPADVGLSKFLGTYPQSPWGWLASYAPGQALGYQGIAYVAASDYAVDANASLGNHTFEVAGLLKDACNDDVNPKDIIVDFLTNLNYGVPGFSSSRIGDLTQLSNYCDAAGVRISPSVAAQRPAHEWLTEFAQIANSAPIWSEGKLKVLPYCDAGVSASVSRAGDNALHVRYSLTSPDYFIGDMFSVLAVPTSQGEVWAWVHTASGFTDTRLIDLNTGVVAQVFVTSNGLQPTGINSNGDCYAQERNSFPGMTGRIYRLTRAGAYDGYTDGAWMFMLSCYEDQNGDLWLDYQPGTGVVIKFSNNNYTAHTRTETTVAWTLLGNVRLWWGANRISGRMYAGNSGTTGANGFGYWNTTTGAWTTLATFAGNGTMKGIIGLDGNLYVGSGLGGEYNKLLKYDQDGNLLGSCVLTGLSAVDATPMQQLVYSSDGYIWAGTPSKAWMVSASNMVLENTYTLISGEALISPLAYGNVPSTIKSGGGADSLDIRIIESSNGCFLQTVTYTPDTTPAYDLADDDYIISGDDPPIVATRKKQTTAFNIVQVEYLDRANDYNIAIAEVKDQASIEAYGELPLPILRLHGITTNAVAMQVAQAILQRVCYVRKEYKFKLSLKYSRLEPMDGLTLTDARLGMNLFPVRVTEVSEDGDEVLSITAEERVSGISSANTYSAQGTGAGYMPDNSVVPGNVNPPDVFMAPAELTASGYEVWAAISNMDPNYGGCHIWASYDNATYQKIGTLIGNSRQGFLTAALPAGADPDTVNTLAVDLSESAGALDGASQAAVDAFDTLCLAGNEFVAYRDSALTAASKYNLTYLRRGVYGSTQGAAINARFVRCDQALFKYAFDPALLGFTLYLKFVGFNKFGSGLQDIATLTPVTITLSGSLTKPAAPSNFYIGQSGTFVTYSWIKSADIKVRWNAIRYVLQGAPVRWQDGIVLNPAITAEELTTSHVVPGAWSFMLAAEDAGGNFSTPVTRDFTVANPNTVRHATQEAAPGDTAGSTLTNMVKHWTGKIFPRSQNLANADGWDTFDVFVPNPYADCAYETAEIDLGSDQTVRAWAALWADMMPDTTLGFAQPQLLLDYKLAAGAYGGFQPWSINMLTARYVKMKFTLNTAQGTPVIRLFNPTLDA